MLPLKGKGDFHLSRYKNRTYFIEIRICLTLEVGSDKDLIEIGLN